MQAPSSAKREPPQGSSNSTSGRNVANQYACVRSPRHQRRQPRCVLVPSSATTWPSRGRTTNTRAFAYLASGSDTSTGMTWPGRSPETSTAVPEAPPPRNASSATPTRARATTESAMYRHQRTPQVSHSRSPSPHPASTHRMPDRERLRVHLRAGFVATDRQLCMRVRDRPRTRVDSSGPVNSVPDVWERLASRVVGRSQARHFVDEARDLALEFSDLGRARDAWLGRPKAQLMGHLTCRGRRSSPSNPQGAQALKPPQS